VEQVEDALGKSGLGDFTSEKLVARDGARFYGVYDFPSLVRPIVVGDGAGMRLTLNNSFDRTTGVDFSVGLKRLICLNGMMTLVADTSVTKKHSHKLTLDFITDSIHSCQLKFEESIKDFGTLAQREITQEQGGFWTISQSKRFSPNLCAIPSRWFGMLPPTRRTRGGTCTICTTPPRST